MATTNPEVSPAAQDIVKSFSGRDKSSNFEDIARDVYNLNRDQGFGMGASLDYINKNVNMKDLGFAEDFEILGVEADGSWRTRGVAGQIQTRDGMNMEVTSAREADVRLREIKGRKFTDNGDGTLDYTVNSGDTMSRISRAVMTERLGRKPTEAEVRLAYNQIAEANGISDAGVIHPGQKLRIPQGFDQSSREPATSIDRKEAGATEETNLRRGADNIFNPLASPGLAQTDDSWISDQNVETVRRPDGSLQRKVTGELDAWGSNPNFTGHQSFDNKGRLTDSHMEYSFGTTLRFENGRGDGSYEEIESVKSIDTIPNADGNYVTTIKTEDGVIWRSVTNSDGNVLSFKKV